MDARVIFTDEFKNNTAKPISRKERAELRWKRLVAAEESGELQNIKTRVGLGNFVGITDKEGARSYTVRLLNKGVLEERLVSKTGTVPEYEYHLKQTSSPYTQNKKTFSQEPQSTTQDHAGNNAYGSVYTVKVEYGWGKIAVESADKDGIVEIIKALRG